MLRSIALALIPLAGMAMADQTPSDPHRPEPRYDSVAPQLPKDLRRGAVLIVSKTNGWRHFEHLPHSNAVLSDIARGLGHDSFATENAAVFNDAQLRRFSVVVLNSASGDFLTRQQREAFARFVARGGGVVALHAAGDDSHKARWYIDTIIGTRFIGHPGGGDHFQKARVTVAEPGHPVMAGVSPIWIATDEWYSFAGSPAKQGMTVLARIDEASYRPGALAMGADHPVIWINPRSNGRVLYSALGHTPESYDDPQYRRLLANALRWAADRHAPAPTRKGRR